MKIALCVITKNENLYLRDWAQFYFSIGVDTIFLYDNNPVDGENPQVVLQDYILNGKIVYNNVRGQNFWEQCEEYQMLQHKVFIECYQQYRFDYDWFLFFDVDEYIELREDKTLKEFLSRPIFEKAGQILINWRHYGDNNKIFYEPQPVLERFLNPTSLESNLNKKGSQNIVHKAILRGKLLEYDQIQTNGHFFIVIFPRETEYEFDSVNCIGEKQVTINSKSEIYYYDERFDNNLISIPYNYDLACLRHYTYTISESLMKKNPKLKAENFWNFNGKKIPLNSIDSFLKTFFHFNAKTSEKEKIIEDYIKNNS